MEYEGSTELDPVFKKTRVYYTKWGPVVVRGTEERIDDAKELPCGPTKR